MNWGTIAQALGATVTSVLGLIGVGGRRHRLRSEIKANMDLLTEVRGQAWVEAQFHSQVLVWMESRIGLDVARLCEVPTGNEKKPILWGTVAVSAILAGGAGWWAWELSTHRFNWWSVPLWIVAGLMVISLFGQFTNREIPQQQPDTDASEADSALEQG